MRVIINVGSNEGGSSTPNHIGCPDQIQEDGNISPGQNENQDALKDDQLSSGHVSELPQNENKTKLSTSEDEFCEEEEEIMGSTLSQGEQVQLAPEPQGTLDGEERETARAPQPAAFRHEEAADQQQSPALFACSAEFETLRGAALPPCADGKTNKKPEVKRQPKYQEAGPSLPSSPTALGLGKSQAAWDLPGGSAGVASSPPDAEVEDAYLDPSSLSNVDSSGCSTAARGSACGSGDNSPPPARLKEDHSPVKTATAAVAGRKRPRPTKGTHDSQQVEAAFVRAIRAKGWELRWEDGDGNCLFRAVSTHIYGDSGMHAEIRHKCTEFMAKEAAHFSRFVAGDFNTYISKLRQDGVFGSNLEIQCMTELFNRPIEIYVPENGATPINIFHGTYKTGDMPMRLSYHGGNHYNSIVNPKEATVGLGLGIPAMMPAAAEQELLDKTLYESQMQQIDQVMKNKILTISDWEQTERELEQAAIQASLEGFEAARGSTRFSSQPGSSMTFGMPQSGPFCRDAELKREDPSPKSITKADKTHGGGGSSSSALCDGHDKKVKGHDRKVKRHRSGASPPQSPPLNSFDPFLYPESVQEMLFNGFALKRVLRAYEMVGDSSDAMLMVLMSTPLESPSRESC